MDVWFALLTIWFLVGRNRGWAPCTEQPTLRGRGESDSSAYCSRVGGKKEGKENSFKEISWIEEQTNGCGTKAGGIRSARVLLSHREGSLHPNSDEKVERPCKMYPCCIVWGRKAGLDLCVHIIWRMTHQPRPQESPAARPLQWEFFGSDFV